MNMYSLSSEVSENLRWLQPKPCLKYPNYTLVYSVTADWVSI